MGCGYDMKKHGTTGKVADLRFETDKPRKYSPGNHNIIATVKFDKSGRNIDFWSYGGDVGIALSKSCMASLVQKIEIFPEDGRRKKDYEYLLLGGIKDKNKAYVEESGYNCTLYIDC